MIKNLKKPDETALQQLSLQKRRMEKELRKHGLSREQAKIFVSNTFKQESIQ